MLYFIPYSIVLSLILYYIQTNVVTTPLMVESLQSQEERLDA